MAVIKLSTPGVYVQEISVFPPSVAEVETAIPAFVGYTSTIKDPTGNSQQWIPKKISSYDQYETYFGGAPVEADDYLTVDVIDDSSGQYTVTVAADNTKKSNHIMAYSVKHFFDNGGATCYIVTVGDYGTPIADADLTKGLKSVEQVDEVTLLVVPEAVSSGSYKNVIQAMINQASDLKDRFAIIDPNTVTLKTPLAPTGDVDTDMASIRNNTSGQGQDRYAAAYYPNLASSYPHNLNLPKVVIKTYTHTGTGPKVKTTANVDLASGNTVGDLPSTSVLYANIKTAVNALTVVVPPSGAIAGLYARIDNSKGVWKAPANESLQSVNSPTVPLSDAEQGSMNIDTTAGKSVNAIRQFPGFGTLVWGARTLEGNDNEWRYISVRRFFNMVEESIKKSIHWAVFEPNTIDTWVKVQAMIENYLFLKWNEGALAGTKPDQAYFVNVGLGKTMTSDDILNGIMNVEIGMAVARPAEFIVLKFSQMVQQS